MAKCDRKGKLNSDFQDFLHFTALKDPKQTKRGRKLVLKCAKQAKCRDKSQTKKSTRKSTSGKVTASKRFANSRNQNLQINLQVQSAKKNKNVKNWSSRH